MHYALFHSPQAMHSEVHHALLDVALPILPQITACWRQLYGEFSHMKKYIWYFVYRSKILDSHKKPGYTVDIF